MQSESITAHSAGVVLQAALGFVDHDHVTFDVDY
jgi:hypothetical protein